MPNVNTLFFAEAKARTKTERQNFSLAEGTHLRAFIFHTLVTEYPSLRSLLDRALVSRNQEFVDPREDPLLIEGDEIAIIPPLNEHVLVEVTSAPISLDRLTQFVGCAEAGAISTFSGTTRNNFNGKKVLKLKYKAYEPMAIKEMRKIVDETKKKWNIERAAMVPIGEASVIIAFSSAHRRESLEAVSWAIDELKAKVPVWKKEYYEDSKAVWKENSECCMPSYASGHADHSEHHHHHREGLDDATAVEATINKKQEKEEKREDPCHKLACAIQTCLQNNGYQQSRCQDALDAYNRCVEEQKKSTRDE
ncbi:molybdopterin synthase catalytic subunit-like [Planoprotostelium fungivorum]|uniref:Molybdopterin synthase catalytic subunit-like n=1 Tax=Planoprotostelium fungivorum TaxID=1890364 RepID=A0A2P6MZN3_9EUKA|nr:molybdopterin synthase catalytic subunit-like [Planoprotostelium fungivorum]